MFVDGKRKTVVKVGKKLSQKVVTRGQNHEVTKILPLFFYLAEQRGPLELDGGSSLLGELKARELNERMGSGEALQVEALDPSPRGVGR